MYNVLDLCSGIGGFTLGLKLVGGFRTLCYVEIDAYCQRVGNSNTPRRRPTPTANRLDYAILSREVGGSLNPTWVEWLMGYPLGWTDLEHLEMQSYRQWLRLHGKG
jgi:site-specific DNA-cytosine methylase